MPSKRYTIGAAVFKNQDQKCPTVNYGDVLPTAVRDAGELRDVLAIAVQNAAGDAKEVHLWSDPDGTWSGVAIMAGLRAVIKEIEEQEGPPVPFRMTA